jgi:hypothetical protein
MIQLFLILIGLFSNSSPASNNDGNVRHQIQSAVGDTGGDEGHPIPPRIIGG